jgi:hypothetical protein
MESDTKVNENPLSRPCEIGETVTLTEMGDNELYAAGSKIPLVRICQPQDIARDRLHLRQRARQ